MNDEYGFDVEVSTKYDRNVFRLIQRCFCALPLATVLSNSVFVVHGGLPRRKGVTLHDMGRIQRFRQVPMPNYTQPEEDEIFQDMLWSDPVEDITGWRESQRGAGVEFGRDVTEEFLKNNDMTLVVRSHEECLSGYEEFHNKKLITVFSASNYDGPDSNFGATCIFIGDLTEPSYHTYQIFDDEYEDPQVVNLQDSFALATTATFGNLNNRSFSNFMSTGQRLLMRKRTKDDILRELRERIYQRRHRLMAYFCKLDRTNKGSVWMIEWVESMRNVLNLNLPWYFLRGYFVEVDSSSRIRYASFLGHFHNMLQSLWLEPWKQSVCSRLLQQQRANHRSQMVGAAFSKDVVTYNEFCSVLRAIDYTMSDTQIFQLFRFFDTDEKASICGPDFVKNLQLVANQRPDPLRWDADAMEQLQNIVIQGRTQLASLFKVSAKDKVLTEERFMAGMAQIGRGMRKQLSQQQKQAIFQFLKDHAPATGKDEISFDSFLVAVYVFDSRCIGDPRTSAYPDLGDYGLTPVLMKNGSFSSLSNMRS
ncbi:protein phosphatase [Strigomonas culicis]|uniref:Protein phosphatase n=1 Tax=Strigomonas culicis TaxID=28005 RepID=S9U9L7_9TRYP|nr:protein phosphatase [Strigomonas culicis]|eukprot:EPY25593.1 protein phosphatase [Strigomonas culicis]